MRTCTTAIASVSSPAPSAAAVVSGLGAAAPKKNCTSASFSHPGAPEEQGTHAHTLERFLAGSLKAQKPALFCLPRVNEGHLERGGEKNIRMKSSVMRV